MWYLCMNGHQENTIFILKAVWHFVHINVKKSGWQSDKCEPFIPNLKKSVPLYLKMKGKKSKLGHL